MHLRVSTAVGTPVIADQEEELVGFLSDVLIHPDTGHVEGFFVQVGSWFWPEEHFISTVSILSWGTAVHIRSRDYISPADDILRVETILNDPRRILYQPIITKDEKTNLGICADLQYDTKLFRMEWLFPRKFLTLRAPIPANDIVEITPAAIIVREPLRPQKEVEEATTKLPNIPEVLSPVRTMKDLR